MNSKKTIAMLACIGSIFSFGDTTSEKTKSLVQNTKPTETLTLIGKKMIYCENPNNDRATLFFDTDGNTNTTEVIARISMVTSKTEAGVFDAKIGEKKTKEEWAKKIPLTPSNVNFFSPWNYVK